MGCESVTDDALRLLAVDMLKEYGKDWTTPDIRERHEYLGEDEVERLRMLIQWANIEVTWE